MRRPPRYSIEHIYFNREREGEFEAAREAIEKRGLSATQARELSSPFLPGYQFRRQTPDQLARHFGASFVMNLLEANPQANSWVGPVRSTYGLHYVWLSEVEAERAAALDEVQLQLTHDLESRAKKKALRASLDKLRDDYEIRL